MTITREDIVCLLKEQGHNSYVIAAITESISIITNRFYKQGYELGRQRQRESDAECIRFMFTDKSLGETFALIIRNNTGDLT